MVDYIISSSLFTFSYFMYFIGYIPTTYQNPNFFNVMIFMGNACCFIAYCYYIRECILIHSANIYQRIKLTENENENTDNPSELTKNYVISNGFFVMSYLLYFISYILVTIQTPTFYYVTLFIGNIICPIAYCCYIKESILYGQNNAVRNRGLTEHLIHV